MRVGNAIYMDYQSTTPLDPAVKQVMEPYLGLRFGNPHSSSHRFGWEADAAVEAARGHIASLLGVSESHVVFTSGATEANNQAIKGVGLAHLNVPKRFVTIATEHSCVLQSALSLRQFGHEVIVLPVRADGLVDLDQLADAITPNTALLSVMLVNNEIGVIQPIAQIAEIARAKGVLVHCDAAQAAGKIAIADVIAQCDMASFSAHKLYGPKGVGALYVKPDAAAKLVALMDGGGQEAGLRSGTLAPALCAGFGEAARLAGQKLDEEGSRAARHFDRLVSAIDALGYGYRINGSVDQRLKSNLNVSFEGVDSARLMAGLRRLAVSSGAACASAKDGPSYVLDALEVRRALAASTLRIGTGRFTDDAQVSDAAGYIGDALKKAELKRWSA